MKNVIILTIGLVVGADATIFTALNAILLKPLPVAQPEQLFRVAAVSPRGETREDVSYAAFMTTGVVIPASVQETLSRVLSDQRHVRVGAERAMLIQPGAPRSIPAARSLASLLFAVTASDRPTWAGVLFVIALTVATATAVPARRAMSVSPVELLRET